MYLYMESKEREGENIVLMFILRNRVKEKKKIKCRYDYTILRRGGKVWGRLGMYFLLCWDGCE